MFHVETPSGRCLVAIRRSTSSSTAEATASCGPTATILVLHVGRGQRAQRKNQGRSSPDRVLLEAERLPPRVPGTSGCRSRPRVTTTRGPAPRTLGRRLTSRFNAGRSRPTRLPQEVAGSPCPCLARDRPVVCLPEFPGVPKYTGCSAPEFEIFRDSLAAHHMLDQAETSSCLRQAPGLLYKEEMKRPADARFGGFQLLDSTISRSGTAWWACWTLLDSKGYISRKLSPVLLRDVPLLRMKKCTWTTDETFQAEAEIAHYGRRRSKRRCPSGRSDGGWERVAGVERKFAPRPPIFRGSLDARPRPPAGTDRRFGRGRIARATIPLGSGISWAGSNWTWRRWLPRPSWSSASRSKARPTAPVDIWVHPTGRYSPPQTCGLPSAWTRSATGVQAGGRCCYAAARDVRSDVPPGFATIFWNTQ